MLLPSPKEEEQQQQQQQPCRELFPRQQSNPASAAAGLSPSSPPPAPVDVVLVESPWIPRPQLAWAFSPIQLQQPLQKYLPLPLPPSSPPSPTLRRDVVKEFDEDDDIPTDENRDPRSLSMNCRQRLLLVEMESDNEEQKKQQFHSQTKMGVPITTTTPTIPCDDDNDDDYDQDDGRGKLPPVVETRLLSHGSSKTTSLPTTKETTFLPTTRMVVEENEEPILQPTQQQLLWLGWSSSSSLHNHNQSVTAPTTVVRQSPRRRQTINTVNPFPKSTHRGGAKWTTQSYSSRISSTTTRYANKKIGRMSLAVSSTPTTLEVPSTTGAPELRRPATTISRPIHPVQVTPLKLSKGESKTDW